MFATVATLQETNISPPGEKENHPQICQKSGGYVNFLEGTSNWGVETLKHMFVFWTWKTYGVLRFRVQPGMVVSVSSFVASEML